MIAALIAWIAASPGAPAAVRYGAIALAVLLFLLSLRRTGERAGRIAERLETTEEAHDVQRGCWKPRVIGLALATTWLTGCATVGSEQRVAAVCRPVV